jgi:hypothetical protein
MQYCVPSRPVSLRASWCILMTETLGRFAPSERSPLTRKRGPCEIPPPGLVGYLAKAPAQDERAARGMAQWRICSVAPMMDWTGGTQMFLQNLHLDRAKMAWHLYGTSLFTRCHQASAAAAFRSLKGSFRP